MKKVGMIGAGNMGGAILRGMISDGFIKSSQVFVYDKNARHIQELSQDLPGVTFMNTEIDVVIESDIIILAVKPNVLRNVLDAIRPAVTGKAIISIAAGWSCTQLQQELDGTGATYLRVMPNTPAMVGEGMTVLCGESNFSDEDFEFARGIFNSVGKTAVLPESMMDGVIAISGSSPAYVYIMIEAMADAGVKEGLPRAIAYELAAQAVLGSALMVLQSGTHPAALKDAVCSPGGTTIEAVQELERKGFRSAIMDAMAACARKSRDMSK